MTSSTSSTSTRPVMRPSSSEAVRSSSHAKSSGAASPRDASSTNLPKKKHKRKKNSRGTRAPRTNVLNTPTSRREDGLVQVYSEHRVDTRAANRTHTAEYCLNTAESVSSLSASVGRQDSALLLLGPGTARAQRRSPRGAAGASRASRAASLPRLSRTAAARCRPTGRGTAPRPRPWCRKCATVSPLAPRPPCRRPLRRPLRLSTGRSCFAAAAAAVRRRRLRSPLPRHRQRPHRRRNRQRRERWRWRRWRWRARRRRRQRPARAALASTHQRPRAERVLWPPHLPTAPCPASR
mmetsp:Transcript_36137/g.113473  ORF Transcript_36137/g.113473 Transcript_36137/m.113473 type:complete len:294 (+) Transcript_36137:109-990(+)